MDLHWGVSIYHRLADHGEDNQAALRLSDTLFHDSLY